MDEDDDFFTAMAREFVTRKGVGEQASEIWRQSPAPRLTYGCFGLLSSRRRSPTNRAP
jgi:hypothetical protein